MFTLMVLSIAYPCFKSSSLLGGHRHRRRHRCCCVCPLCQLDAKEDFVSPGTENLFQDDFWESLDFVTNALDNVKARVYVDSR